MKKATSRKWLLTVIGILTVALVICNIFAFAIDPFFQYRVSDTPYMLNPTYCSPGLIKDYDYDTLIIGSSMTQNFDMDVFRTNLNCSPLHIGIGGMTNEETAEYVLLANNVKKAENYYICIDISDFRIQQDSKNIDYLMKNDILSRLQYSISFEATFRFMPVDIAFSALTKIGYALPASFKNEITIDKMGYWGDQYKFGKEIVLKNFQTGIAAVSAVDTTDLYNRLVNGMDIFFSQLDLSNANYNFFFPPYSVLYWAKTKNDGYLDVMLDAKEYFIKKATENGATVYDFQGADFTTDLDNYKDTTHYAPKFNDWMTECFSKRDYIVVPENYSAYRNQLTDNVEEFMSEYGYLFNNELPIE